jgi:hypothetical protein
MTLGELMAALRIGSEPKPAVRTTPDGGYDLAAIMQGAGIDHQRSQYERTMRPGETRSPEELRAMLGEVVLAAGSMAVPGMVPRAEMPRPASAPRQAGLGEGAIRLGRSARDAVMAEMPAPVREFYEWRRSSITSDNPNFMSASRLESALSTLGAARKGEWEYGTLAEAKVEASRAFNALKAKLPKEQRGVLSPLKPLIDEP